MLVPPVQTTPPARASGQQPDNEPPSMPLLPDAEVPKDVVDAMKAAGATYYGVSDGDLCMLDVCHGDPAWEVYAKWLGELTTGTMLVCASFRPSVHEVSQCPSRTMGSHITWEVNSIVYHFAGLRMDDLGDALSIPGPVAETLVIEKMRDPRVALTPLIQCIRDPPEDYETLHGLAPGMYICDIQHIWTGTIVMMAVYK